MEKDNPKIEDTIQNAVEDALEDLDMEETVQSAIEGALDALDIEDILQSAVEDALTALDIEETVRDAVEDALGDLDTTVEAAVQNAFQNMLSELELVTPDGTHIIPRKKMRLTAPDKAKVLLCYGGLRVDDTSKFSGNHYPSGWGLSVQTRVDSWEVIYVYGSKDQAVLALEKANKAMKEGLESFDL